MIFRVFLIFDPMGHVYSHGEGGVVLWCPLSLSVYCWITKPLNRTYTRGMSVVKPQWIQVSSIILCGTLCKFIPSIYVAPGCAIRGKLSVTGKLPVMLMSLMYKDIYFGDFNQLNWRMYSFCRLALDAM